MESSLTMHPPHDHQVATASAHAVLLARLMIVLVLVLHTWMAHAAVASGSHAPAGCAAGWGGCESGALEHGHDHDHDDADNAQGERASHQHGHDPTDHSHDKPDLPREVKGGVPDEARRWDASLPAAMKCAPCFALERPPRRNPIL